jgi:hypothetical protein
VRLGIFVSTKDPVLSAAGRLGARRRWGDAPRVVRLSDLSPDQARLTLSLVELFRAKKAATTDENVVAAHAVVGQANDRHTAA